MAVGQTGNALTYTYNADFDDNRDKVRFLVGDVRKPASGKSLLLSDEEIAHALTENNDNPLYAAIELAEHLSARFTREGIKRASRLGVDNHKLAAAYRELAQDLRNRNVSADAIIQANLKSTDRNARLLDTTLNQPSFTRDMHTPPENRRVLQKTTVVDDVI